MKKVKIWTIKSYTVEPQPYYETVIGYTLSPNRIFNLIIEYFAYLIEDEKEWGNPSSESIKIMENIFDEAYEWWGNKDFASMQIGSGCSGYQISVECGIATIEDDECLIEVRD